MQLPQYLTNLYLLAASSLVDTVAPPAQGNLRHLPEPNDQVSINKRGSPLSALSSLIIGLMPQIVDVVNEENEECKFTERARELILLDYPNLNGLIFSGLNADVNKLNGSYCFEVDMSLGFWRMKTYKVCALKNGTFMRSGDGGCRNWAYGECFHILDNRTIFFYDRTGPATTTPTVTVTVKAPSATAVGDTTDNISDAHTSGTQASGNKALLRAPILYVAASGIMIVVWGM